MPKTIKKSTTGPLIMIGGGVILLLVLLVWQLASSVQPGQSTTSTANIPYANIPRVSLVEARQAYDARSATFLDVRDTDSFNSRHVTGAIIIPIGELEARFKELDANNWIIPYCT